MQHNKILIKSAGRTASHLALGLLESAGYTVYWTEQYASNTARSPIVSQDDPQVWYDHQQGWPNPGMDWCCVLIRRRDRHSQIISRILAQYTGETVLFTDRVIPPRVITPAEWRWHADWMARCESEWRATAPRPLQTWFTEDLIAEPHRVVRSVCPTLPDSARSRFPINPRPLASLCVNWAETKTWPIPHSLI